MSAKRKAPHLRLVTPAESNTVAPRPRQAKQLTLPYVDPYTVVLSDVSHFDVSMFLLLLQTTLPRWIVDARLTPRLDTLAGTRANAFALFRSCSIEYVDLSAQFQLRDYWSADWNPAIWGEQLGILVRSSHQPTGPFLILFDDERTFVAARESLLTAFESGLHHKASIAIHQL